jgi:signal transduction histidine kinase
MREDWFAGGGEMGALMRATDWSKTKLGPVEQWPRSLRTMLGVVLRSRFPMLLWWGPELLHLYNDAYRPILRDKHPASLAAPAAEVWAEVWDAVAAMAKSVQDGGPASWTEDMQLFIHSGGMAEETYFTFSYSPVPGDDGQVGGLLNTVQETTAKVQSERQIRMLHELSARATEAKSEDEVYRIATDVLSANELDLPFVLIYALDDEATRARLVGVTGWTDYDGPAKPARVAVAADGAAGWPIGDVVRGGHEIAVEDLAARFGSLPAGKWQARPERAIVLPLVHNARSTPHAVLIAGVSPHRTLDDRYRRLFRATADQVTTALANVHAYETERKRAEALAEIDRAKTAFFSNVSHEFRTPLTLMLGPTEDALASPAQALSGEALHMVRRNTLRLMKLVNSLLDFSRIESGRVDASYAPSDLTAMTSYLASSFRSAIEHAGLVFDVACEPLPEPIFIDSDMWERIVLNLLSNALKFTFEGSIGVAVRWRGDHAEVEVRDTGTGVPAHELPHLFERFHRVQGAKSRSHEGSGIGLALVHELVRLHGGAVAVHSALDRGTTFTIKLPRGSGHLPPERVVAARAAEWTAKAAVPYVEEAMRWVAGSKADAAGTQPTTPATRSDARILVVDDNADLRGYIESLLRERYIVDTAVDGEAALETARRHKPSLVLSDVMMPRLDGFGLLAALRADPALRSVPLILLSARAGEEATIEGLEAGADDYLVKPFAARELLARVRTHVELARQHDALARAKDAADAANRELESFSYSVAHDLRAPLRSIDGFSQALLEDHAGVLDAEGQRYLASVRESTKHMAHLIDDLLELSRVSRSELRRDAVDVSALARASITRLEQGQPSRSVAVAIEDGLTDDADPRLLAIVLDNLLGNAWKFTGRRDQPRIELGASSNGERVYFVRDNGAGFDMAAASKLFGVFQRLHAASEFEGTGIGLATVQRIVHRHRGRVWAEAAVDRGATFFFTLHDKR